MCKLMIMSGITDQTRVNAWKFVKTMAKTMSANDNDGMGYAAVSENSSLFGERWHKNSDAFVSRNPLSDFDRSVLKEYSGLLYKTISYNSFGDLSETTKMTSITLHARMATSGKQFINTHPFVANNTSLIHNGVISNTKELWNKDYTSSCDSETILREYLRHRVYDTPKNIQRVADRLSGYYACGIFSSNKKHGMFLDIFKDTTAQLNAVFIQELNTVVFSTSLYHVETACRELGFTIVSAYEVDSGYLARIDAISGEVIDVVDFSPEYKGRKSKGGKITNVKQNTFVPAEIKTLSMTNRQKEHYPDWEYDDENNSWTRKNSSYFNQPSE